MKKCIVQIGKSMNLIWSTHDSGCIILRSARYSVSGTSIARASETKYNTWNKEASVATETYIFRVVGYK